MCARSRSVCASARRAQRPLQQTVLRQVLPSPVAGLLQVLPARREVAARTQGPGPRLAVSALWWCLMCSVKEGLTVLGSVCSTVENCSAEDDIPILWITHGSSRSACCPHLQARALMRLEQVPGRRAGLPSSSSHGKSPRHPPRRRADSRLLRAVRRRCTALQWLLPARRRLRSLSRS